MMQSFARVADGRVAEIFSTDRDITTLFHAGLHWVPADGLHGLAVGWGWDGAHFTPPAPVASSAVPTPGDLGMQIATFQQRLDGLVAQAKLLGITVPTIAGPAISAPTTGAPAAVGGVSK